MPSWNSAWWNPSNDDGPWTVGTPTYQRPDYGGWFWFRKLTGNTMIEIMGIILPNPVIASRLVDWFGFLPAGYGPAAARMQPILISNGPNISVGNLLLNPDGGVWIYANHRLAVAEARFDVFLPLG